jgi:hypothetical protein
MEKRLNRSFMLRKTKVQLKMSKKRKKLKVKKLHQEAVELTWAVVKLDQAVVQAAVEDSERH